MTAKKPKPLEKAKPSSQVRSESQAARRKREAEELIRTRRAMAKARYETDPKETQARLARELGISRQALNQIVREEGWVKALDGGGLAQAANIAADRSAPPPELLGPIPPHPTKPPRQAPEPDRLVPPATVPDLTPEATAAAVNARADVLSRHRTEWRVVRGLLQEAVGKRDLGKAKLAKVAGETLKLAQDGERKAWGLDLPEAPPPGAPMQATVRVVVTREGTPPIHIDDEDDNDD